MESGDVDVVRDALAAHDAFEPAGDGVAMSTSPFDARVMVRAADGGVRVAIHVEVPTLDAVVEGETVAAVVEEGWFDTFSLRLEDVDAATRGDVDTPAVRLDADRDRVVVETVLTPRDPESTPGDAKAVVDYVEGTYVEGVIPGYTYREPVTDLVDRARATGATDDPAV